MYIMYIMYTEILSYISLNSYSVRVHRPNATHTYRVCIILTTPYTYHTQEHEDNIPLIQLKNLYNSGH